MNGQDWLIGSVCLGMPLGLALFALVMWQLRSRMLNFACPGCGRRIAKAAVQLTGVSCPHCDWQVGGGGS
jgi:hypothetical protein